MIVVFYSEDWRSRIKYRDFGQNDHTFHKMYQETVFHQTAANFVSLDPNLRQLWNMDLIWVLWGFMQCMNPYKITPQMSELVNQLWPLNSVNMDRCGKKIE